MLNNCLHAYVLYLTKQPPINSPRTKHMHNTVFFIILLAIFCSCQKAGVNAPDNSIKGDTALYFPPLPPSLWQQKSPEELAWNTQELTNVYAYLAQKKTRAFIILHQGKIVAEKYFGTFTADSSWYWASAGKTMTAFLVGIAQQEGSLNISDKTAKYLGTGFTSLTPQKENLITIRHQLTMTTGLNDGVADVDCTLPACLEYKADAGTRWAYHNAAYTLLDKVLETATKTSFNNYFQQKLRDKIGMNGIWIKAGYNNVLFSTLRSMARFGLLMLNKGIWNGSAILNDSSYFNAQISTSQTLNQGYGYLTWLNGKSSYMLPTTQYNFSGSLVPNAPADMYAALGKNDQKIYVVPSMDLVIIRMGDDAGNGRLAASSFDNELWGLLRKLI